MQNQQHFLIKGKRNYIAKNTETLISYEFTKEMIKKVSKEVIAYSREFSVSKIKNNSALQN